MEEPHSLQLLTVWLTAQPLYFRQRERENTKTNSPWLWGGGASDRRGQGRGGEEGQTGSSCLLRVRMPSKRVSNPFRRQEESVQSESSRTAPSEEYTEHGTRTFAAHRNGHACNFWTALIWGINLRKVDSVYAIKECLCELNLRTLTFSFNRCRTNNL